MTSASEALNQIVAAVRHVELDTAWGDEDAKVALGLATLALDKLRRVLEAPVLAHDREVSKTASTIPASEAA